MLPRVDFGHLYKFLVSVGLVLVVAAATLPWLILRDPGPLAIPQAELEGFTPEAQEALLDRQHQYAWIGRNYPIASGALAALGFALIGYGFFQWRKRQLVLDEKENIERDTARVAYERLSPAERQEKIDVEVHEVLEAATTDQSVEDVTDDIELTDEVDVTLVRGDDTDAEQGAGVLEARIRQSIEHIEAEVDYQLRRSYAESRIERDVRIQTTEGEYLTDFFVYQTGPNRLVQVLSGSSIQVVRRRLKQELERVRDHLGPSLVGSGPLAVTFLLVVDGEGDEYLRDQGNRSSFSFAVRDMITRTLAPDSRVSVTLLSKQSLERLSWQRFRRATLAPGAVSIVYEKGETYGLYRTKVW